MRTLGITLKSAFIAIQRSLLAVVIGLAAFFVVYQLKDYTSISEEIVGVQDRLQLYRADTRPSNIAPPFVLVDFDQKAEHDLSYPAVVPRNVLADIISVAAAGHPRLIVLDVDLGWSDSPASEEHLLAALNTIDASVPVLLVRQPFGRGGEHEPDTLKQTRYDAVVAASRNLAWVSAKAAVDGDGITRRYYNAPRTCPGGETRYLPSVQIAACAALSTPGTQDALRRQMRAMPRCGVTATPAAADFVCAGHHWPVGAPNDTADIVYRMRWKLPDGHAGRPQMTVPGHPVQVEEVEVLNALTLASHHKDIDPAAQFGGRVVIIGSSADVTNDTHITPIGIMPGMLVVANGIRSALEIGPAAESTLAIKLAFTALISLFTYALWDWAGRMRHVGHPIFREFGPPLTNTIWLVLIGAVFPSVNSVDFLVSQLLLLIALELFFRRKKGEHP